VVDVVHQRGGVAELHALDPFGEGPLASAQVWWCDPTDAALVLGSRQPYDLVDPDRAAHSGLVVTRRRSGGGVVIVRPEAVVWIDVVLPHGIAPDDVRGAMEWIGDRWKAAVAPSAVVPGAGDLTVHRGGMLAGPWSDLVCFAGIGPGEVLLGGRKLVGLSQRRTRHGLRLQGLAYRAPLTAQVGRLLIGELPASELGEPAFVPGLDGAIIAAALAGSLD
jgi:lipoate-protein ligase A